MKININDKNHVQNINNQLITHYSVKSKIYYLTIFPQEAYLKCLLQVKHEVSRLFKFYL